MGPALSDRDSLKSATRGIGTVIAGVGPNFAMSRWPTGGGPRLEPDGGGDRPSHGPSD